MEAAGLIVGSVRSEDLVTLKEIAARTRRSYESVRPWFALHAPASPVDQDPLTLEHDRLIAAADHLVRARALMRGDHLADGLTALVSA